MKKQREEEREAAYSNRVITHLGSPPDDREITVLILMVYNVCFDSAGRRNGLYVSVLTGSAASAKT